MKLSLFTATGIGAKAMEELADAGQIAGILDISPKDIPDLLFGGIFPAGPDRMTATCRRGIPQVVVPGTADFILHPGVESVPAELLKRKHVIHNPLHTHIRATFTEMEEVGKFIAERLAKSTGPAYVVVPTRGFSQLNFKGGPMYDPESDKGFLKGLRDELKRSGARNVIIEEHDLHINDADFAEIPAKRINALIQADHAFD